MPTARTHKHAPNSPRSRTDYSAMNAIAAALTYHRKHADEPAASAELIATITRLALQTGRPIYNPEPRS